MQQLYYIRLQNWAKPNITCEANITGAANITRRKANIAEKSTCESKCFFLAGALGLEPRAYGFGDRRSTN